MSKRIDDKKTMNIKRSSCAKQKYQVHVKEELLMTYFASYQEKHQLEAVRKAIARYAIDHTNAEAARIFECHRNTVSDWKQRYIRGESLTSRSRAPKTIPHKIQDQALIDRICKLRDDTDYGSERLEKQYDLPISNMTIHRILVENNAIKPLKKKRQTKNELWGIKQHYKTLETKLQMDGKDLMDIPRYYAHQKRLNLPKQQFNIRCVKSGITFTSFMNSESGAPACTFIVYVFEHLIKHGVDVSKLTIQIDAASYAISMKSPKISEFRRLIEDTYKAKLKIVPGGKTKQSDVETFNGIVEREFFDRYDFSSIQDFYKKVYLFMFDFNYVRKNRNKDWHPPLYFLNQDQPNLSSDVLMLPPIDLDLHHQIYSYKIDPKHLELKDILRLELFLEEIDHIENKEYDEKVDTLPSNDRYFNEYVAHDVPIYVTLFFSSSWSTFLVN